MSAVLAPWSAARSLAVAVALAFGLSGCVPVLFQEVLITAVVHSKKRQRQDLAEPAPAVLSKRPVPQVPGSRD